MLLSNFEYVPLRLIRRFLLTDDLLLRFGHWFPYYRVNQNQVDPTVIVERYVALLAGENRQLDGTVVLEIGAGSTNSAAYALAVRGRVRQMYVHEPFVELRADLDSHFLQRIASSSGRAEEDLRRVVTRLADTSVLPDHGIDVIVSHSVLEHVSDPAALFSELFRLLKPDGIMIHLVDYRDHFFKYPCHFLQFDKRTWDRFLNPGDLPRWRVSDHLRMLGKAGFEPRILESSTDDSAFEKVRPHLSAEYDLSDPDLAIMTAVLIASPSHAPSAR